MKNIDVNLDKLQLAENAEIVDEYDEIDHDKDEFVEKRKLLEKTKIVKQTWSVLEIYQKIKSGGLVLNPDYQRNEIWSDDKKTAFIESLYMDIMVPPIYVVEIPGENFLEENKYEVVDGKQRLTAVQKFLTNELRLVYSSLEYYQDLFGGRKFDEISKIEEERTNQMLSSVLDVYVITANSPEFTKYDIFARLNKGAEKLKVNEIRRAIYHSDVSMEITNYINGYLETTEKDRKEKYKKAFSKNDIKRFEDYGRFYRTIAFNVCSDIQSKQVKNYNSRPRDMINNVLQDFQKKKHELDKVTIRALLEGTLDLKINHKETPNLDYLIDMCAPFIATKIDEINSKWDSIINDDTIKETFIKSPSTTANVNNRLKRIIEILGV